MDKSPDAFRTISEVAEVLETPAHVLRFWESRFPQIRPVKRAGGRRYYRPTDVALLTGIKHLLHDEGLTIRGVQKILREQGVRHVAGLTGLDVPDETEDAEAALEAALAANFSATQGDTPAKPALPQAEAETAQVVALETALRVRADQAPLAGTPATQAEIVSLFDLMPAPASSPTSTPIVAPPAPFTSTTAEPAATPAEPVPEAAHWLDPELEQDAALEPWVEGEAELGSDAQPSDTQSLDTPSPDAPPSPATVPPADIIAPAPAPSPASARRRIPDDGPLIDRLRALPAGALADRPNAHALRSRLMALAQRKSAPPPPAPPPL